MNRARLTASLSSIILHFLLLIAVIPAAGADETVLPIPPLATGEVIDGVRSFDLTAAPGSMEFREGESTPTLGYNGDYLGPTIRLRRGEDVAIRVKNDLDEETTVHWHGVFLPAESDGGPHQTILPGEDWTARFTVRQPAATLWYHPHPIGSTGIQVYEGLSGLMIVDDEESEGLGLPSEYGVNDIPLVVQDRTFDRQGNFVYVRGMPDIMHGIVGEELLVNGALDPVVDLPAELVRLRILNGSDSNVFRFDLSFGGEALSFHQIATDGGLLPTPVETDRLVLATGERAEILLDLGRFEAGDEIELGAESYQGPEYRALRIRVAEARGAGARIPDRLVAPPSRSVPPDARERDFVMNTMGPGGRLTINGRTMDMDRIDVRVPRGTAEVWRITNPGRGMMAFPHAFHIHNGQFLILDINGQAPPPELAGWKDTFLVWPNDEFRVRVRFEDYTGIYMYHCHFLVHEDEGMMGQFEVTE